MLVINYQSNGKIARRGEGNRMAVAEDPLVSGKSVLGELASLLMLA